MPAQQPSLKRAGDDIGQFAEQGIDNDSQHDHVELHEFARLHRHIAKARLRRNGLRHDQSEPHNAERETQADEDGRQSAGENHFAE